MKYLVVIVLGLCTVSARAQDQLELHLVLAFDVSASVNDVEFNQQRQGTADALRDPKVVEAIVQAKGGVAISIVQWSSVMLQELGLEWAVLRTAEDVHQYANRISAMPRKLAGGGTMIHAGLEFSGRQLEKAPGAARRQVIDLSGNGRSDDHDQMLIARDRLLRQGVVINALAIDEHNNGLAGYFEEFLIGGAGSFVITADEFEDYRTAMQIKLYREISGAVFSGPVQPSGQRFAHK